MKIAIIDDEKAMHLIMKRMLTKIDEVEIVGCFNDTLEAFSFLMNNQADLVFVDISMLRENGLDLAKRLREADWNGRIVFVTSHKEYALSAFDVFAFDYIVKPVSQERLHGTIQRALKEEIIREVMDMSYSKGAPPFIEPLTKREIDILQLMSVGMTNKEIAVSFDLSEGTVKNHIVHIFDKLQVKNRVQASAIAKEYKLIK